MRIEENQWSHQTESVRRTETNVFTILQKFASNLARTSSLARPVIFIFAYAFSLAWTLLGCCGRWRSFRGTPTVRCGRSSQFGAHLQFVVNIGSKSAHTFSLARTHTALKPMYSPIWKCAPDSWSRRPIMITLEVGSLLDRSYSYMKG